MGDVPINMSGRTIRLLLCDVDGTLTGADGRGHSARLLPAMQRLMARGVKIGVVSGRDTLSVWVVHRLFDLNGPIIAENGAEMILRPAKGACHARACGGLSPRRIAALVRMIAGQGLLQHVSIDPGKKRMLTLYPNRLAGDLSALSRRVAAIVKNSLPGLDITCSSAAIDICARGVNKSKGIAIACRSLRMSPGAVAFVGDSRNDQAAFEYVGRHGGWIAFVGTEEVIKESLRDYPRVYFPRERGSEGSAEFIEFLSEGAPLAAASEE
jgi:3-deoxy-D-manno-octulosonate 8-phosphate phosphatase KdsC-like HAD superfamily phosphatase